MGNLTQDNITVQISTNITSAHGLVTPGSSLNKRLVTSSFTSATGTYQVSDTIAGGVDTIDLKGSLEDDLGDAITFNKVNFLHYENTSATGTAIVFDAAFPIHSAISLVGGAHCTIVDDTGILVTATTNDTITVTGTTGLTYNVVVIGIKD